MFEKESPSDLIVRICERTKHELLAMIHSTATEGRDAATAPAPAWMTAAQLAEYWQFVEPDGKPRTAGILKWTKRPPNQFPLPHAYMGDLMRFNREDVDKWAKEGAERRRVQNEGKRLKLA